MPSNQTLYLVGAALLLLLTAAYSNHFRNDFAFDDAHVISNNAYIRDLGNIPQFFTDARTFSSNPSNQMYRPLLSTLYAVDYRLAGDKLDPLYFHLDSFAWYLGQLVLMFFFFRHLFDRALAHRWNGLTALIATAFYGFHTANAETINYISARSDSLSTFWLIAAFVLYFNAPKTRWHGVGLFLLPLAIGLLVKPAILVFPALLFLYAVLFEDKADVPLLGVRRLGEVFMKTALPALLLCGLFYVLLAHMTPATFTPGGVSRFEYMITQPYVALHYFENFLLPVQLVADTDWVTLKSVLSVKFFVGVAFVGLMLAIAWLTHGKREWRPVCFGILWFFVALVPSSSIIPFAEVLNDHRTFFPYVGLVIALVWAVALYLYREDARQPLQPVARRLVLALAGAVIAMHGVGVHARNEVWRSDESLWRDVVDKAPGNGRGWMNYGLALMARADYNGAEQNFSKALELWPSYAYGHINMAILKAARDRNDEADGYFRKAIELDPRNAEAPYFYARFLAQEGRTDEAIRTLETNLQLSPAHLDTRHLLLAQYQKKGEVQKLHMLAADTLKLLPDDPVARRSADVVDPLTAAKDAVMKDPSEGNYIELSLQYYRAKKYDLSVQAAEKALSLNNFRTGNTLIAHNNICIGNIMLGEFDKGEAACKRALGIKIDYTRARNNLALGRKLREQAAPFVKAVAADPSPKNHKALSLFYYRQGMFQKAIAAAGDAARKDPADAEAFNYICSAHNSLGNYDDGITACQKAIALNPEYQLAKNNLAYARSQLSRQ